MAFLPVSFQGWPLKNLRVAQLLGRPGFRWFTPGPPHPTNDLLVYPGVLTRRPFGLSGLSLALKVFQRGQMTEARVERKYCRRQSRFRTLEVNISAYISESK